MKSNLLDSWTTREIDHVQIGERVLIKWTETTIEVAEIIHRLHEIADMTETANGCLVTTNPTNESIMTTEEKGTTEWTQVPIRLIAVQ
jgi:hypothetical protein